MARRLIWSSNEANITCYPRPSQRSLGILTETRVPVFDASAHPFVKWSLPIQLSSGAIIAPVLAGWAQSAFRRGRAR